MHQLNGHMYVYYPQGTMISQIIKLRAHHPKHGIKTIKMDNAVELSSRAINGYHMALGINVEHSIPYVHRQNGLAKSLTKRIKLVAKPLLQN